MVQIRTNKWQTNKWQIAALLVPVLAGLVISLVFHFIARATPTTPESDPGSVGVYIASGFCTGVPTGLFGVVMMGRAKTMLGRIVLLLFLVGIALVSAFFLLALTLSGG
jgi:hypothetical protein